MKNPFPYTPEFKLFQEADETWSAELTRIFGKDACHARYQLRGIGDPGTELYRLHNIREEARAKWLASGAPS